LNRIRLALLGLCAFEALFSTPLTFTSGTLLWARQADSRIFDVTPGGNLSGAPEIGIGTGYQNGQLAFTSDLTAAFLTSASTRRVLKITPGSSGPVIQAQLPSTAAVFGVVVTPENMIYASTADGKIYDVTSGTPAVVATGLRTPRNMLWTPSGILVVEQGANRVTRLGYIGGNTGPAQTFATGVVEGTDIEMFNGRIYVTSLSMGRVYDITSGGEMTSANIFASGQEFIGIASANGKMYATNFADSPKIFDITGGGVITNANIFGHGLPGGGDTMFDAVPSVFQQNPPPAQEQSSAVPEPSALFLFGTGALVAGCWRRRQPAAASLTSE
jgi:hypothetical protein